jgi:Holliday junction resolvasome RuvABC DNA-binding subunit
MILDLATKMREIDITDRAHNAPTGDESAQDATRALVSLGYSLADADRAVRAALDASTGKLAAAELIRKALAHIAAR